MIQQQPFGDSDGWIDEDFVFASSQQIEVKLGNEQTSQPKLDSLPVELPDDIAEPDAEAITAEGAPEELGPSEPDAYVAFVENKLLDAEEPIEAPFEEWVEYPDLDGADYEGTLTRPIFVLPENDVSIKRTLQVDEWLASLQDSLRDISAEEREEVAVWTRWLVPARFGSWFPWLRSQNWDGRVLLAFLRFQAYWDANWELWAVRIPRGKGRWIERHQRHTMSREMALELAKLRIDCAPEDVIEESWIEDWRYKLPQDLMERGIFSLAQFALYMAEWQGVEPWNTTAMRHVRNWVTQDEWKALTEWYGDDDFHEYERWHEQK